MPTSRRKCCSISCAASNRAANARAAFQRDTAHAILASEAGASAAVFRCIACGRRHSPFRHPIQAHPWPCTLPRPICIFHPQRAGKTRWPAGSCFAQRIAEALQHSGYGYMVTEPGPPFLSADDRKTHGYGVYSARYGNIYTTLQLLQLVERAYGRFEPAEPLWRTADGAYVDQFRPAVQPGGYATESECLWDRRAHLAAVRAMFEQLDVFVFTLGLTEAWLSDADGAVFPVCPGSGLGGVYDPQRHRYHNFSVAEVSEQLTRFVDVLAQINPRAQVIVTVSPVPLMATFEARHVLQASTYSKSVLRVACEELVRSRAQAHYFASYEIVSASGDSNSYFAPDRRSVTPAAVE